jgi:transposase
MTTFKNTVEPRFSFINTSFGKQQQGFEVLPKRWIVERTLGWFNRYRRLSKDYERRVDVSEGMVYIASIRRMLRWLDRYHNPT